MHHATDRRGVLSLVAAGAATMALGGCTGTTRTGLIADANARSLGVQLYALGEEVWADPAAAFARLARWGYATIELPGEVPLPARDIRRLADDAGLAIVSMHADFADAVSNPDKYVALAGEYGARDVVIPFPELGAGFAPVEREDFRIALERYLSAQPEGYWQRSAERLNIAGEALRKGGLRLGYHHHNMEFAPLGTTSPWNILLERSDPALVGFQIDTGWCVAGGRDPVDVLRSASGRVLSIHVKDVARSQAANFALGIDPANVGTGQVDWERVLPAARDAGADHFFFEQEPPFAGTRMDAAESAARYLRGVRAFPLGQVPSSLETR